MMLRDPEVYHWIKKAMNQFKDYIESDISIYMVKDYMHCQYSEPAQIIAYEDSYQIVEAISSGAFLGDNEQTMLRKDKREKMLDMLKQTLSTKKKINLEADEADVDSRSCLKSCILF